LLFCFSNVFVVGCCFDFFHFVLIYNFNELFLSFFFFFQCLFSNYIFFFLHLFPFSNYFFYMWIYMWNIILLHFK
jgi:hypothetical protein